MARKKGKGRAVKRARQKFGLHYESEDVKQAPHTIIINRNDVNKSLRNLCKDFRTVMEPYTASNLRVQKKNTLKDFIAIAGPLHVTHLLMFSETDINGYLKIIRLPRGPTLHFQIEEFSLCKDVQSSIKKPSFNQKLFLFQPLLILNGFHITNKNENSNLSSNNVQMHHKLMATMFQNMFPSINITKVQVGQIKRCVMFNFNNEDETIEFRHYNIKLMPVGLSRPIKKLALEKLPNLADLNDISEFIEKDGLLSESEAEFDTTENQVLMPHDLSTRSSLNLKSTKSAVRLIEIGPRIKMKLLKIQEGICDGTVLYHKYINKTPEELDELRKNLKAKKKELRKANKKISDEKSKLENQREKKVSEDDENCADNERDNDVDDDIEYYKQEVGKEPDADFFTQKQLRKRKNTENDDYLKADAENVEKSNDKNTKQKIVRFNDDQHDKIEKPKPKFFRLSNKKRAQLKSK